MRKYLITIFLLLAMGLAGCGGGGHRQAIKTDCHFVPKGNPHALAAKKGLACPNTLPKALRRPFKSTGLREMDDSTDVNALASGYPAYAGYTDGLFQSYGAIRARFAAVAQTVGIDVLGGDARSTDLEPSPGNFQNNPDSAGPWARNQINNTSNKRPVIYTMGSWQGAIEQSLANNGVPRCSTPTQQNCYLEWIAVWDNNPVLYTHMTVHQFIDHGPNGENRDRSVYDPSMLFASAAPPLPPMHYEWYAQQQLKTPWGNTTKQEYIWIFNYDWARPYYGKNRYYTSLILNLQTKMKWWANGTYGLAYRIHHRSATTNTATRAYGRYGNLIARGVHGKVCKKIGFAGCQYG